MRRQVKADQVLDKLNEAREHLAILLSLAEDAEFPDRAKITDLRRRLKGVEGEIARHRPAAPEI